MKNLRSFGFNALWVAPCLLFAAGPACGRGASPQPPRDEVSVEKFVHAFYDWYVPIASNDESDSSVKMALREKGFMLDPSLLASLQISVRKQGAKPGFVSGLDFDPFLGTQDPFSHYKLEFPFKKNGNYFVNIKSIRNGKLHEPPDVVAEVKKQHGSWVFSDFHYSNGHDLINILKGQ